MKSLLTLISTVILAFPAYAAHDIKVGYYFDETSTNYLSNSKKYRIANTLHSQLKNTFNNSGLSSYFNFVSAGYKTIHFASSSSLIQEATLYDRPTKKQGPLLPLEIQMKQQKLDIVIGLMEGGDKCGGNPTPVNAYPLPDLSNPSFGVAIIDISCYEQTVMPAHEVGHGMGLKHGYYISTLYGNNGNWDNPIAPNVGGYGKNPWFGNAFGTVMAQSYVERYFGKNNNTTHNFFSSKNRYDCGENNNQVCRDNKSDATTYLKSLAYTISQRSEFWK